MSRLLAVYNLDGQPIDICTLASMEEALTRHGHEPPRRWSENAVALSHCALRAGSRSAVDLQPVEDPLSGVTIIFDGRLDNRDEITGSCSESCGVTATETDARAVLKAYNRWGESCLAKLIGDFAIVIWDRRRQWLLCARDPIGVRPLYYYCDPHRFVCCSDLQPLFRGTWLAPRPSATVVNAYLNGHFRVGTGTLYELVQKVEPAHYLIVQPTGGPRRTRYWSIDLTRKLPHQGTQDYVDEFRHIFRRSVERRLDAADAVGVLLSGGVDSSSIVCTARDLPGVGAKNIELIAFSGVAKSEFAAEAGDFFDERGFIEEVVSRCNIRSHYYWFEDTVWCSDLVHAARRHPDTLYTPALELYYGLLGAADRSGVKVLLNGMGGDELLGADPDIYLYRFADLIRSLQLRELCSDLSIAMRHYPLGPTGMILWQYGIWPLVESLAARYSSHRSPQARKRGWTERSRGANSSARFKDRICAELFDGELTWFALEELERMCAYHGLEPRYPFLDLQLIEFVIALPAEELCRHFETKLILRRSMKGILPERIRRRRTKATGSPLVRHELAGRHRDAVAAIFAAPSLVHGIDWYRIRRLFHEYCAGTLPDESAGRLLQRALGLELWHRTVVEGGK